MIINKLQLKILKSQVICLCHLAIYSEIIKWQRSLELRLARFIFAAFQSPLANGKQLLSTQLLRYRAPQ